MLKVEMKIIPESKASGLTHLLCHVKMEARSGC